MPHPAPQMSNVDAELNARLAELRAQGLYRELQRVDSPPSARLQVGSRVLLNFSSNDYLGLANEPAIKEAAARALERFGAGAGSSRLLCGSLTPHQELDETLAGFHGTPAALSFASGYATAIGTICALAGKGDVVIIDKLVHACIVDAARLSGAQLRVFAHNDLNGLEDLLKWAETRPSPPGRARRTLIVIESVYSMDGDHAPLRELVALKEKHGAWLMVDEAHATGLYGQHRRGLAEECGVSDQVDIHMGTLGKAAGASGGYICGSRTLIDYLINRARTFIFSTAPVPAAAAAAAAGLRFIESNAGAERRDRLWRRVGEWNAHRMNRDPEHRSAIIPLILGAASRAVAAAAALRDAGLFIPAIRYPTVARNRARLRLTLTAAHEPEDIQRLVTALRDLKLEI